MDPGTETEPAQTTRLSLHAVAEHVLSAALHAATGRIGLRQTRGGFGTPPFPSATGERRIRVVGTELAVSDNRGERRATLRTLRQAAALAEVEPGAPTAVYTPSTPLDLDAPLMVDGDVASRLADWYELVNTALEHLRADLADEEPAIVQLWPEHFDMATAISGVNYGGSPGDEGHPFPYLYVGPSEPPEPDGGFWNETFGASRAATDIDGVDGAIAFFARGRRRLES
jgi:hypothetical protein